MNCLSHCGDHIHAQQIKPKWNLNILRAFSPSSRPKGLPLIIPIFCYKLIWTRYFGVQQWMTTRGSYVHKPMVRFSVLSENAFFCANYKHTKQLTRLFELIKHYKQNPLFFFYFFINSLFTQTIHWLLAFKWVTLPQKEFPIVMLLYTLRMTRVN